MAEHTITIEALRDLTGGKTGIIDVACPFCGPSRKAAVNRIRKVMRVWDEGDDFVTFHCERCGASGYANEKAGRAGAQKVRHARPAPASAAAEKPDDKTDLARNLWSWSIPANGSLAETYLRSRQCWVESESIRFLPRRARHSPTMIARFGAGASLTGVHLTRLADDGRGKAGTEKDKIMIGPSKGQPIIVHRNEDRGELIIAEGIEDAASWAVATGWNTWAAGSAGRIAAVLDRASEFSSVYISLDFDDAGLNALENAKLVRPDLIVIDCAKMVGPGEDDANRIMIKYGAATLLDLILRTQYKAGKMSLRQLQRQVARHAT